MYRGLTWLALHRGLPLGEGRCSASSRARTRSPSTTAGRVFIAGTDVTAAIRQVRVDRMVPVVASHPEVREVMRERQRELADQGDAVIEGRDIGTVVAPDAEVKVYLVADPAVRDARRQAERPDIGADALATDLKLRDESDRVADAAAPPTRRRSTRRSSRSRTSSPASRSSCASERSSSRGLRRFRLADVAAVDLAAGARPHPRPRLRARSDPAERRLRAGDQPPVVGRHPARRRRCRRGTSTTSRRWRSPPSRLRPVRRLARDHRRPPRRVGPRRGAADAPLCGARRAARSASSSRAPARRAGIPARRSRARRWLRSRSTFPSSRSASTARSSGSRGNFAPCSIAVGEPFMLEGCRRGGKRLQATAASRSSGGSASSSTGSPASTRAAAPGGAAAVTDGRGLARRRRRRTRHGERRLRGRRREPGEAAAAEPDELIGTVAIVGFPNVGKSTLSTGSPQPRRRRPRDERHDARPQGARVRVGGEALPVGRHRRGRRGEQDAVSRSIVEQAGSAIAEADLVLLVVDARAGVTPGDEELATIVRNSHKPVLVLANKIDDPRRSRSRSSSIASGSATRSRSPGCTATTPATCSTRSSRGSRRAASGATATGDEAIRVAILGRPNVGKSSLFNALVGAERTIVSEVPGHDPRRDRHRARARRPRLPADRHGGPPPQAQAAAGDRLLLGAARARRRRPGRRRARPRRRERGDRRGRPRGRRRRAQGAVLDARRALEVGSCRR